MAKSIWSIINGVAWQNGIENPAILEGGVYESMAARHLRKLSKKCLKSCSQESFLKYIRAKARYIKSGKLIRYTNY